MFKSIQIFVFSQFSGILFQILVWYKLVFRKGWFNLGNYFSYLLLLFQTVQKLTSNKLGIFFEQIGILQR